MPKVIEELKDFVSPGRLTDPFNQRKGSAARTKRPNVIQPQPSGLRGTSFATRRQVAPDPFADKRKWPYYVAPPTDAALDKAIVDGRITEEEVPVIMRITLAVAQARNQFAPTLTDFTCALELRSIEQIKQIIVGTYTVKIPRTAFEDPRQQKSYWISAGKAVLAKLEPAPAANP